MVLVVVVLVGGVLVVVVAVGWGRREGRLGEGWLEGGNEWAVRGAGDGSDGRGDLALAGVVVEVFGGGEDSEEVEFVEDSCVGRVGGR